MQRTAGGADALEPGLEIGGGFRRAVFDLLGKLDRGAALGLGLLDQPIRLLDQPIRPLSTVAGDGIGVPVELFLKRGRSRRIVPDDLPHSDIRWFNSTSIL